MKNEIYYGLWSAACLFAVIANSYKVHDDSSYFNIAVLCFWSIWFAFAVGITIGELLK